MDDTGLCPYEQAPKLILQDSALFAQAAATPERVVAALAPGAAQWQTWSDALAPLAVGLALDCPPPPSGEAMPHLHTTQYIADCKRAFRPLIDKQADFYWLRGAETFSALRAAVLAVTDLCGYAIVAELTMDDDEGHLRDGTEICAAVGVLQRIGVTTVVLRAAQREALSEALIRVQPYARLSLGAVVKRAWLEDGLRLAGVEMVLAEDDEEAVLDALGTAVQSVYAPRDHDDFLLAPDGRHAHFIQATIDISDEIECGPRLEQALIDAEDDAGALKLVLETEDDIVALEQHRYMITRPVCLCAESAELLEQGLRVFTGLALYDGTWEQDEQVLLYWEHKYGLIRL